NISYASASPQAAASVANAVVQEYINLHSDDEFQRSQRVIDLLEDERKRREDEVDRLRKKVVTLSEDVTGKDPYGGTSEKDLQRAVNPIGALFQSLTAADVEQEMLQAELQSLSDPAGAKDPIESTGWLDLEIDKDGDVRELQHAIKDISTQ